MNWGSSARPSSPRSQPLNTRSLRSAYNVGVGSPKSLNTWIVPRFSATKMRPSAANRTAVGNVRPLNATVSWKPGGTDAAAGAAATSHSNTTRPPTHRDTAMR